MRGAGDVVRIAGAGPAGLCAAIVLARGGVQVELHEQNDRLGHRFPEDLHGIENWSSGADFADELAALGIVQNFECTPCREVLFTNGGRPHVIQSRRPVFYMVSRGSGAGALEQGLLDQALESGARVVWRSTLTTPGANIVATGPNPRRRFCVAVGIRFLTRARDQAVALVHEGSAARGYAYLLVRSGVGCLCSVLFDDFAKARRCLESARAIFERQVDIDIRDPEPIGGYGSFCLAGKYGDRSTLQIGEAAGVQDFVWGFGIRSAMMSGALAARCWLAGKDYAEEARLRFDPAHRASVVSRLVWESSASWALPAYTAFLNAGHGQVGALRFAYKQGAIQRLLFPAALDRMARRYPHLNA